MWWGLHSTVALLTFLQLLLTLMADVLYAAYYKISGAWVWWRMMCNCVLYVLFVRCHVVRAPPSSDSKGLLQENMLCGFVSACFHGLIISCALVCIVLHIHIHI